MAIGVLSVLPVLPVVAVISSLFRLREVKFTGSEAQQIKSGKTEKDCFEGEVKRNVSPKKSVIYQYLLYRVSLFSCGSFCFFQFNFIYIKTRETLLSL